MGIIIKLSNNIEKTNSIIINFNFGEQELNKYKIPNKSIIININGNIKIKSKKFSGININDYEIWTPSTYQLEGFDNRLIYEAEIVNRDYNPLRKGILEDNIKITNLIGEKGTINYSEFAKL